MNVCDALACVLLQNTMFNLLSCRVYHVQRQRLAVTICWIVRILDILEIRRLSLSTFNLGVMCCKSYLIEMADKFNLNTKNLPFAFPNKSLGDS
jgi:hypothetical protein